MAGEGWGVAGEGGQGVSGGWRRVCSHDRSRGSHGLDPLILSCVFVCGLAPGSGDRPGNRVV